MSCHRGVHQSSGLAARCGIAPQTLEAAWAEGRNLRHISLCPICRNCILRADGGCTKCEQGLARQAEANPEKYRQGFLAGRYPPWAMAALAPAMLRFDDTRLKLAAIPHLTDPGPLAEVARSANVALQGAAAANPHTPAEALAVLVGRQEPAVYQAAAQNPSLPLAALAQAAGEAEQAWQELIKQVAGQLLQQALYGAMVGRRGSGVLAMALSLGFYGYVSRRPYRRYSALRGALRDRQRGPGLNRSASSSQGDGGPSGGPLSPREQDILRDGLDLAAAYLEQDPDYYRAVGVSGQDLERIRKLGVETDQDRALVGEVLAEMEQAEQTMPGWFKITPAEFKQLRAKLGGPALTDHEVSPETGPVTKP